MPNFYAVITNFRGTGFPPDLEERSANVKKKLIEELPSLNGRWVAKYVFDDPQIQAIDIVASDRRSEVEKAAEIISEEGRCHTKVIGAASWQHILLEDPFE